MLLLPYFTRAARFLQCLNIPLTRLTSSQITLGMSQQPKILSVEELSTAEAKWITLQKIKWQDPNGHERIWESAARKTQSKSGIDAVDVLAIIRSESNAFPPSTIIIEQYRPPLGKFVIELPAGLVDKNESPEEAAIRELEEETGFKSSLSDVFEISPFLGADPGMSNVTMKLISLNVRVPPEEKKVPEPKQKLDEGEFIVRRAVEIEKLYDILQDYSKKDFVVDARLSHFASGYETARKMQAQSSHL